MAKKSQTTEAQEQIGENAPQAYYAYADFEMEKPYPVHVKKGEQFVPPHGWVRDLKQEELMTAAKHKSGAEIGVIFVFDGEVINPQEKNLDLRERRTHNVILPLEVR